MWEWATLRGNDGYANAYEMDMSLSNLEKAMRLGKLGEQIFIKSPQAFERLKYMGSNIALKNEYYPKWLNRDNTVRSSYFAMDSDLEGTFIMNILRESWRDGDERIQRIVR